MKVFALIVVLAVAAAAQPIVQSRFDSCISEAHDAAVQQLLDLSSQSANRRQHQREQFDAKFQNAKFAILRNALSVRDTLSRQLGAVPNALANALPQIYSQLWTEIRKVQTVVEADTQKPAVDLRPLIECFLNLSAELGSSGLTAAEFRQLVEQLDTAVASLNRFVDELGGGGIATTDGIE